MMPEQLDLLIEARDSLAAAKLLQSQGYHGFAASRAYYTMFYVAEAFLLGKGLAFSKHSGVHGAFGLHFCKAGVVPKDLLAHLTRGMELRHTGDYGKSKQVTADEASEQIAHAEQFMQAAEQVIGPLPSKDENAE
jgi:uncharacterized protein (UPF0332 family)